MDLTEVRKLYLGIEDQCWVECSWKNDGESVKLSNGIKMRLALPFKDAIPKKVLLNGKVLDTDSFSVFKAGNFTYVEIIVSEINSDLLLAVVEYDFTEGKHGIVEFN